MEHGNGDEPAGEDLLEALPGIIAVATLGVGATTAVLNVSGEVTGAIFVVGWLLLTPLSAILADTKLAKSLARRLSGRTTSSPRRRPRRNRQNDDHADEAADALEELKERYARGEIDDAEFERRTAMLVENESIDDVRDRVDRPTSSSESAGRTDDPHEESERERRRDEEYET